MTHTYPSCVNAHLNYNSNHANLFYEVYLVVILTCMTKHAMLPNDVCSDKLIAPFIKIINKLNLRGNLFIHHPCNGKQRFLFLFSRIEVSKNTENPPLIQVKEISAPLT